MMEECVISIVVPIYNVEKELDRCIQSLRYQTYSLIEIILVDDGSTDGSSEKCDDYACKDNRIQVIHKKNGGLSSARNEGLKKAKGTFILYVDSDDFIELDTCERFVSVVDEEDDFIVGSYKEVRGDKVFFKRHTTLKECVSYSAKDFVIESIKANEWYAPAWLCFYNRDFLIRNNLFFKEGYLFEDMEMLPRLYGAAKKVKYLSYDFYNYIIRENSITTSKMTSRHMEMILDIYQGWLANFSEISEKDYRNYLYGVLVKHYLKTCRDMKIYSWSIQGLDSKFAMKYSLNFKELLKIILFTVFPKLYCKL